MRRAFSRRALHAASALQPDNALGIARPGLDGRGRQCRFGARICSIAIAMLPPASCNGRGEGRRRRSQRPALAEQGQPIRHGLWHTPRLRRVPRATEELDRRKITSYTCLIRELATEGQRRRGGYPDGSYRGRTRGFGFALPAARGSRQRDAGSARGGSAEGQTSFPWQSLHELVQSHQLRADQPYCSAGTFRKSFATRSDCQSGDRKAGRAVGRPERPRRPPEPRKQTASRFSAASCPWANGAPTGWAIPAMTPSC